MGRVRTQRTKPTSASKVSLPKRKRNSSCKKKLASPIQAKEKITKCSVCLDTTNCRKMKILLCSHTFHKQCVNKWLETHKNCPLCRMPTEKKIIQRKVEEDVEDLYEYFSLFALGMIIELMPEYS